MPKTQSLPSSLRRALLPLALLVHAGCPSQPAPQDLAVAPDLTAAPDLAPALRVATAAIRDRDSTQIGTMTLSESADGKVRVVVDITRATPGRHGVHLHAEGKCEVATTDMGAAGDFLTAGGHFNPTMVNHGDPNAAVHHAGDFGNLDAMLVGANGTGRIEFTSADLSLRDGPPNSAIGKSIIFHAGTDDFTTQPTGNSGARTGCGVIALR